MDMNIWLQLGVVVVIWASALALIAQTSFTPLGKTRLASAALIIIVWGMSESGFGQLEAAAAIGVVAGAMFVSYKTELPYKTFVKSILGFCLGFFIFLLIRYLLAEMQ